MTDPLSFIHDLTWDALPDPVQQMARLNLLDLIGVAAAGTQTPLSRIIRDHACDEFGGNVPMLFDDRRASASGVALAAGMTIDSIDAHDGFNPAKGHIGCPLLSGMLPLAHAAGVSGRDFLATLVMGYEFGARASVAQHATVPDYHTSGSWGAVTVAAAGARLMALDHDQTRHALGIAEFHGPRSQMMRCIDFPTMLKDGSGWGAMAGVSAVRLAAKGFTGAPAITVEQAQDHWQGLGEDWKILQQYYKPYPVCRWAQAPIEAALAVQRAHKITPARIARIEVETFHESIRLATRRPRTTEEAQYSTSFPTAVALVRGNVQPADIADDALYDPEILRLSDAMEFREHDYANAAFPTRRFARVSLVLRSGETCQSDWTEPRWDHTAPPTDVELRQKFRNLAAPIIGKFRAAAIEGAIDALPDTPLSDLTRHLFQATSR
ncbi:MmgE/PrpD family protein [Shimia biformata]|uniref:MmgE/PrpD family protein n=1 Tax=Shimia biformata TaxID=1294299 RepID=UPI0019505C02|nr:MmgE/PrpD family protein [Shimia biformata]